MASSYKRDQNPPRHRSRPFWHQPWNLLFCGFILLGAVLGIAFGGKALGLWEEVAFAVGAAALVIVWILYSLSDAIQRRETGED